MTADQLGKSGCDEATQEKYILNQMFDTVAMGTYRAYLYQLMDDTSDGDPTGKGWMEAHFGIFDYQWHAKPAAQALANVKNLLPMPLPISWLSFPLIVRVESRMQEPLVAVFRSAKAMGAHSASYGTNPRSGMPKPVSQ